MGTTTGRVLVVAILLGAALAFPGRGEAQGFREPTCPATQKKTTLAGYRLANGRVLKTWCIGTDDTRNKSGVAFVATQWSDGETVWIHKCGLPNGRNLTLDQLDLSKRVKKVNRTEDGKNQIEYDFDAANKTLTITTKQDGAVVDTKTLTGKDLPTKPGAIPHPGEDLKFGTEDDVDPVGEGCLCEVEDFDPVERIFIVNSTADDDDGMSDDGICDTGDATQGFTGICTLRAALREADSTPAADLIRFDIPRDGVPTIRPEVITRRKGPLGAVHPVIIDGTTQAAGLVELDGTLAPVDPSPDALDPVGVELAGEKSVVQGLVINRFGSHGISVRPSGGPSGRNFVVGNLIGTDVTGTVALPNGGDGVHLFESPDNTVAGNVIAANRGDGVHVVGPLGLATGNEIAGNVIGTDASGSASLGNEGAGVFVATGVARTNVNGNAIGSNGELGIDREDDSLVPVLTAASSDGARTRVRGAVAGGALTDFTLDFFANRACDPSGFGEGERYLGSAVATTDGAGNVSFDATVPGAGAVVTATATDRVGTTSEFSRCMATTVAPPVVAFSAFRPKVDVDLGPGPGDDGFDIKGTFRLDAASNGIDPLIEEVSLRVGSFAVTLPPGSFRQGRKGRFTFQGTAGGGFLEMKIRRLRGHFELRAEATGVTLSGDTSQLEIELVISDDGGQTVVRAKGR